MNKEALNVLFLCTGNSARSIVGEVLFNAKFSHHGKAYSAGSKPSKAPNPLAIKTLNAHGHSTKNLSSQHVNEFLNEDINLVISVCSNAERECAIWPGKTTPKRIHWPLPDPETEQDFENTYKALKEKLETYLQT